MRSLRVSRILALAVGLLLASCKSKADVPAPRAAQAPKSSVPAKAPSPAEPQERNPEPVPSGPGWVILLASAPQREEAEARLRAMHEARAFAFVKPAEGFPKVLESSSLPGLRPDLHVVVLGVCGVQGEALDAQRRVRPELGDAYVKKLTGSAEFSCPQPVDQEPALPLPEDAEQLASLPFEGAPGLNLTAHRANMRSEMECDTSDLIIRLVLGQRVLAETLFEGRCRGACTPEAQQEGRERLEELEQAIEAGEASTSELDYNFTACQSLEPTLAQGLGGLGNPVFIISAPEPGPHDIVRKLLHLVGVGCGALTVSEPFVGAGSNLYTGSLQRVGDLEARPALSEGPGWRRFSLFNPKGGTGERAGKWFADVEWVDCGWQVKDEASSDE